MTVLRHQSVTPRAELAHARQAHPPGDDAVKRVALNAHEFGEAFSPAELASVGDEIDLGARLLGGETEGCQVGELPGGHRQWRERAFLEVFRHRGAKAAVAIEDEDWLASHDNSMAPAEC